MDLVPRSNTKNIINYIHNYKFILLPFSQFNNRGSGYLYIVEFLAIVNTIKIVLNKNYSFKKVFCSNCETQQRLF